MIKAVLFDLDGVLVEMPDAHYEALNKALGVFGVVIGRTEHEQFFNGIPTKKKLEILEGKGRLPEGISSLVSTLKQGFTKTLIPKYCVPEYSKLIMLKELKNKNIKLACCSNSTRETMTLMLLSAQLENFFDFTIGNDEVARPKPDPEMFLKAFERLSLKPDEVLIVEDSVHGIAAAEASGACVVKVKNSFDVNWSLLETYFK